MSSLNPEQQQHVALELLTFLRTMYNVRASIQMWSTSDDWMVELTGKGIKFKGDTHTETPIIAVMQAAMAHSSRTTHSHCILAAHRTAEALLKDAREDDAPEGAIKLIQEFSQQLQKDLSRLELED